MGSDSLCANLEQTKSLTNILWIIVFIYGLVSGVSCILEHRVTGWLARKWDKTVCGLNL